MTEYRDYRTRAVEIRFASQGVFLNSLFLRPGLKTLIREMLSESNRHTRIRYRPVQLVAVLFGRHVLQVPTYRNPRRSMISGNGASQECGLEYVNKFFNNLLLGFVEAELFIDGFVNFALNLIHVRRFQKLQILL